MLSDSDKALVAAICKYLGTKKADVADADSIEVAVSCLTEQFGVSEDQVAACSVNLAEVFAAGGGGASSNNREAAAAAAAAEEADPLWAKYLATITERGYFGADAPGSPGYAAKHAKALAKFKERTKEGTPAAAPASSAPAAPARANDEAAAEAHKAEGNAHVAAGRFREAVECYTDAIEAAPSGSQAHIYYNNRAAAKTSLEDYDGAAEDAAHAVALKPDFVKGHTRLGTALLSGGRYSEAAAAFRAALELDDTNAFARDNLAKALAAERKAGGGSSAAAATAAAGGGGAASSAKAGAAPGGGGMPDLSGLAGLMGGAGGASGGLGGLAGLMQNPAVMEAARNLMSDPAKLQGLASMFGGAGGLGGLASMFGGMGGGGGNVSEEQ